jgi:hypothetical protein
MNINKLKNININFNKSFWNPQIHTIMLKYNSKSPTGFDMEMIKVYDEPESKDLILANDVLKKYKL